MIPKKSSWAAHLITIAQIILLGYMSSFVPRDHFTLLIGLYAISVTFYLLLMAHYWNRPIDGLTQALLSIGILTLSFSTPLLSDDFHRFLWDGDIWHAGEHPFLYTPLEWMEKIESNNSIFTEGRFEALNSPEYYSIYPPVMQFFFFIAALPVDESWRLFLLRLPLLLSFWGSVYLLPKLFTAFGLPSGRAILWLAFPLVWLEGIANLHYETLQAFFLMTSIWFLLRSNLLFSGVFWAFSIATKLLPLLLLPFLVKYLGLKKSITFLAAAVLSLSILFIPFYNSEVISHFGSSLNLYFSHFEFNAGLYYLLRQLGFWWKGYNLIHWLGPAMIFIWLIIAYVLWRKQIHASKDSFMHTAGLVLATYYLFSTTIHPWYLLNPLIFMLFANNWWILAWSFSVFLSYHAYTGADVQEYPLLLALQYGLVLLAYIFQKRIDIYLDRTLNTHDKRMET